MTTLLNLLSKYRRFTIALIVVCAVSMTLCHDIVNQAVGNFREHCSSSTYFNHVITAVALSLVVILTALVIARLRRAPDRAVKLTYWVLTLILVFLCYTTLFILNSEAAHFIQYSLFAVPIYALFTRSPSRTHPLLETILLGTIIGTIDESYQYFVLYAKRITYLDFNDVVTNMISMILGVVLIWTLDRGPTRTPVESFTTDRARSRFARFARHSPVIVLSMSLLLAICLAWKSGLICYFPSQKRFDHTIVLRRDHSEHEPFWQGTGWDKTFHTLLPREALVVLLLLTALYTPIDASVRLTATRRQPHPLPDPVQSAI